MFTPVEESQVKPLYETIVFLLSLDPVKRKSYQSCYDDDISDALLKLREIYRASLDSLAITLSRIAPDCEPLTWFFATNGITRSFDDNEISPVQSLQVKLYKGDHRIFEDTLMLYHRYCSLVESVKTIYRFDKHLEDYQAKDWDGGLKSRLIELQRPSIFS